jgi:hypothetical protein
MAALPCNDCADWPANISFTKLFETQKQTTERPNSMPGIRPFTKSDTAVVASLISKVLHERKGPAPASLQNHLDELFLQNPWAETDIPSYVYEDSKGGLVGFFGILPRAMTLQGRRIRLAFGSNFVVDPENRSSMAAIQLIRAFMKGPQDISITDSANESSRQMLRSLGFKISPIYSLIWARPLQPFSYALHGAARLKKNSLIAKLTSLASPISSLFDFAATRIPASPFHYSKLTTTAEEASSELILQCLASIPGKNWLLPEYTNESLDWVLNFIQKRNAYGTIVRKVIRNQEGKLIGWYVFGSGDGKIGDVLQIGTELLSAKLVVNHLFQDASLHGLIGLHGRMEPQFMDELSRAASIFVRQGSWTLLHTKNSELAEPLLTGNAFFSRLEGEGVMRFGEFGS